MAVGGTILHRYQPAGDNGDRAARTGTRGGWRRVLLMTACPLAIVSGAVSARAQTATTAPAAAPATTAPAPKTAHHHHARKAAAKPPSRPGARHATTAAPGAPAGAPVPTAAADRPYVAASATTPDGPGSSGAGAAVPAAADQGESVIVTGTRSLNTKARDSTSPIDVISAASLRRSGVVNLGDALTKTDASIDIKPDGADTAGLTANIVLRGLNPNETLILLDGVRRHPTSNISADAGPEAGSTAPDINMIPAAAIDHIEVLKDGAAAQYGSDAIAGVVNIITKKTDHGLNASAETGADAVNGDGWLTQLDADGGLAFGQDGYVHLGGQFYHKDFFVRQTVDDRTSAFVPTPAELSYGFVGDNFAVPGNENKIVGVPEETRETLSIAAGETLVPDMFGGLAGYSLITYGHRHAESYENWRTPNLLPTIYPTGFSPRETDDENDFAATLGLKADNFFGFHVNVSTTYGDDETDIGNKNTGNVDLFDSGDNSPGDPDYGQAPGFTPTKVLAQTQRTGQWTNNLDFTKPVTLFGRPLNVAFGAENRVDIYKLGAGNGASYEEGGTQGFAGLRPQNAGDFYRDVYAGYIDIDTHPVPKLDLDFAGRFEHYTDFGNTEDGKVAARYDFTHQFAIRGTISNGTRAPTLAEENFSALNVGPTSASGDLAVNSAAARSIGAVPLKPERSTNASAGVVLEPIHNLSITADIFQINIRDRIVGAGGVTGQAALTAIGLTGTPIASGVALDQVSAYYFANGASTRTQGADVAADYFSNFRQYGTVNWTLALDLNRTRLHHLGIDSQGQPFLTAQGIGYITTQSPRSKLILDAFWKIDKFDVNVRWTRWGQTTGQEGYADLAPPALAFSGTQFYQFDQTPVWLTDLEVGYQISKRWHVAIGGSDIFNMLPREEPAELGYVNVNRFDITSLQIPLTGGFYYGRLNYTF